MDTGDESATKAGSAESTFIPSIASSLSLIKVTSAPDVLKFWTTGAKKAQKCS